MSVNGDRDIIGGVVTGDSGKMVKTEGVETTAETPVK
jgi:hypothetical protein